MPYLSVGKMRFALIVGMVALMPDASIRAGAVRENCETLISNYKVRAL
jgi:hypothetical protein